MLSHKYILHAAYKAHEDLVGESLPASTFKGSSEP